MTEDCVVYFLTPFKNKRKKKKGFVSDFSFFLPQICHSAQLWLAHPGLDLFQYVHLSAATVA